MKRLLVGLALVLVMATAVMGAGYTWSHIRLDFGTTATQFTTADNTYAPRVYLSPSFATEDGVMWVGDSGVAVAHGLAVTHTMAIHGNNLMLETGNMYEQWDLSNMWVICNEALCGLSISHPAKE